MAESSTTFPAIGLDRFGLGQTVESVELLHGGVNLVWRVKTERGAFTVHRIMDAADSYAVEMSQHFYALEMAAAAAGVRVATPVVDRESGLAYLPVGGPSGGGLTAHEWVEGKQVDPNVSPEALYRRLGGYLGRIHALNLQPPPHAAADPLYRDIDRGDWLGLAAAGARAGLAWAPVIERSSEDLVSAIETIDEWDREADSDDVFSHRDLTSANVLDDGGHPVLIDWADSGLVSRGAELGRTALDQFGWDADLNPILLREYLAGYASQSALPRVGKHWCTLWIRGLVVFADQCARASMTPTGPDSMTQFQSRVVDETPRLISHRLSLADKLVGQFDAAVAVASRA